MRLPCLLHELSSTTMDMSMRKSQTNNMSELSEDERSEDHLARSLDIVRRAKVQDVVERTQRHFKNTAKPVLLRRKLSAETVAKWEQVARSDEDFSHNFRAIGGKGF